MLFDLLSSARRSAVWRRRRSPWLVGAQALKIEVEGSGMVTEEDIRVCPGHQLPWFIAGMSFEPSQKLNIYVDFEVSSPL
ncbi:MAG: hypothetical protein U1F35_08165 [Steroidobacteraceae bacterium]